jgi:hypothetical protein
MISEVAIVTECPGRKTYCHDNFSHCTRKRLIRNDESRADRGPRFALHFAVTYASEFVVVDTFGAGKG